MGLPVSQRFKPLDFYNQSLISGYQLLPFRFIRLDAKRYVLTNEVGEYVVLPQNLLQDFVHKLLVPNSIVYNQLKSKHFLLDADSSVALDLLALKYRTKSMQIANFTSLHMFVVTLRCDHSCPYCQVSRQSHDRTAYDMSAAHAHKALEFTFQSPALNIKIEFQGGEPLLNFDLIKEIVLAAKQKNLTHQKNLQFVIATNLSQINEEILQFCLEHDILISTSLDGSEDLHNANRPRPGMNSYQLTIEGIQRVRSVLGIDKVGALMTTTKASLPRVTEIIDEYIRQDFHSIFLRPLSPYGFAIKTKTYEAYTTLEWLEFYKKGLDYILQINKQGYQLVEDYTSIFLNKMLTPFGTSYVDLQSPSGIGISAIIFNHDGEVYASDESRMLAEMGDKTFRLGNLQTDTYEQMMLSDALLDPLEQSLCESSPMCQDCGFQAYCGSDPVYHHATQGDYVGHKAFSGFCKKNMEILRHIITLLEDDPEAKEILFSWVSH
ncbi:His-Xaa-Ser system radical SAM maturase HxsB (plasmid) [Nostoc sp. C057]|uniref:His-Xaa-Ser system radical SAM maturase HxsB n=1 Tax=Nostoc sp. C057 TaxID=2576903 RepID=UPI0015C3A0B7|nr:His-Xaa-Ser system radical SAM maturase HxsB [Nostoc sp. C057]QLE53252.1 His-Xaa-Ser system radical SAM maturase HxsB [Nostoc sp. C057]